MASRPRTSDPAECAFFVRIVLLPAQFLGQTAPNARKHDHRLGGLRAFRRAILRRVALRGIRNLRIMRSEGLGVTG